MDINDPKFAKWLITTIRDIAKEEAKNVYKEKQKIIIGKVATSGSGETIQLYINNSTTAVDIKNPRGFSLTTGQLVVIESPNGKDDNMRYIDRLY
jgi:hypothetical protein